MGTTPMVQRRKGVTIMNNGCTTKKKNENKKYK